MRSVPFKDYLNLK